MANRKPSPDKTEIQKTITPIGQEVPKGGIPIDLKIDQKLKTEAEEKAYHVKIQTFHKDDGLGGKIGPKQISHKIDLTPNPDLNEKIAAKMATGKWEK